MHSLKCDKLSMIGFQTLIQADEFSDKQTYVKEYMKM